MVFFPEITLPRLIERLAIPESVLSDFNGLRRHSRVNVTAKPALNVGRRLPPASSL
jgi:hypothetical protein